MCEAAGRSAAAHLIALYACRRKVVRSHSDSNSMQGFLLSHGRK